MDEQPQQPQEQPQPVENPSDGQPPKSKRPPLTPQQLRKRYLIEGIIVLLVCLWFVYDGWFNPEIHSKAFNKLGSVILAWWFVWDMYTVLKYHRAAQKAPTNPESTPPSSTPQ